MADARAAGDHGKEAVALNKLGKFYSDAGQSAKALEFYNQALPIERLAKDPIGEATTLTGLGEVYSATSEPKKALELYNQALLLERGHSDHHGEGITLTDMGEVYENTGDTKKALEFYNQSLVLQREIHDRFGEATTLTDIGSDYGDMSQPQKALEFLNQALPLWREIGDRRGEAITLNAFGFTYSNLGQQQKALEFFEQSLPVERAVEDRVHEAMTLSNVGTIYSLTGRPQEALASFQQALVLGREVHDRSGESTTLNNIGQVYLDIGEPQKALASFAQALPIEREVGDRDGEAVTLINLGTAYNKTGQPQKGLVYLNQALPILREVGDKQHEATTFNNIALIYNDIGQLEKALDGYNQALAIWRTVQDIQGEANTLNNIGTVYSDLGQPQKALDIYGESLPLRRKAQDRGGEADTLDNIGTVYADTRQPQKALDYFTQGLVMSREAGSPSSEAKSLWHLSRVDKPNTLPDLLAALRIAETIKEIDLQGGINTSLMAYWSARSPSLAIFFGRAAINNFQEIRGNLRGLDKDVQAGFARFKTPVYRQVAELLIQQDRLREAEDVLDLLKEQELKDAVRGTAGDDVEMGTLSMTDADRNAAAGLAAQEAAAVQLLALTDQRNVLLAKPAAGEQVHLAEIDKQLASAKASLQQFFEVSFPAQMKNPRQTSAALTRETKDAVNLRSQLKDLPPGTVAIYTLVTEAHTFLIVTTPTTVHMREATLAGAALRDRVLALRRELEDPGSTPQKHLQEFFEAVIAPIVHDLDAAKAQTILWSLDGVLRNVPLNALYDGHRYLIERYSNVIITPASRKHLLDATRPAQWSILAFGLSRSYLGSQPLDGVDAELKSIVRDPLVPASNGATSGRLLENDAFTFDAFQNMSASFPVVHVASHFIFRPRNGDQSFLLLAGDTVGGTGYEMTMAEMRNKLVFTGVRLLTLSACSTAFAGELPNGGEMDSLGMVAQKNGAAAVISTLWDVNDASTSILMSNFYKRWLGGRPVTKIAALRRVQLDMIHPEPRTSKAAPNALSAEAVSYAHPYYWAPFVLIGNFQ